MAKATAQRDTVHLSALDDIAVLYPGDLRELGVFVAKTFSALDKRSAVETSQPPPRSRQTLYGLARSYGRLILGVNSDDILRMLKERGLDLSATVELDVPGDSGDA